MKNVIVAAIQSKCTDDISLNLDQTITSIEQAVTNGAQLVCLQELFASKYFCQSEDHEQFSLAESIPGPTTERLCNVAKTNQIVIVAGIFEFFLISGLFGGSSDRPIIELPRLASKRPLGKP